MRKELKEKLGWYVIDPVRKHSAERINAFSGIHGILGIFGSLLESLDYL